MKVLIDLRDAREGVRDAFAEVTLAATLRMIREAVRDPTAEIYVVRASEGSGPDAATVHSRTRLAQNDRVRRARILAMGVRALFEDANGFDTRAGLQGDSSSPVSVDKSSQIGVYR